MSANHLTALVLSGGGARGAYQAGAMLGLRDLGVVGTSDRPPFDILVGTSAGALNVGVLAAHADRWWSGVEDLVHLWSTLHAQQVFRTDLRSLGGLGAKWVRDLSFGGLTHRVAPKSLLDTEPLAELIEGAVPWAALRRNLDTGRLHSLVVSAVDLYTANGVAFVDTRPDVPLWRRRRWSIERTRVGPRHLLASAAIPVFFPSVEVDGRHFGDGSVRNVNPLSPAIHLGARRVVTIGVRESTRVPEIRHGGDAPPPTVAEIAGVLLDAVMLDAIEMDVAHSQRVNRGVLAAGDGPDFPFQHVDLLWLAPSESIATIARHYADRIPAAVRYLLRGLGSDEATTELASYLLFDAAYTGRLIELGRADVHARADEIRAFFA
jgi:NTE family protein